MEDIKNEERNNENENTNKEENRATTKYTETDNEGYEEELSENSEIDEGVKNTQDVDPTFKPNIKSDINEQNTRISTRLQSKRSQQLNVILKCPDTYKEALKSSNAEQWIVAIKNKLNSHSV